MKGDGENEPGMNTMDRSAGQACGCKGNKGGSPKWSKVKIVGRICMSESSGGGGGGGV